ncbi:MAG TPA: hypothetical protein VKY51_05195 [Fredinandcohnia sp.]|nr:hypothetical protein [Fredinandcohnia sp.]
MLPIVGEDGRPLYRRPRELIRPELSHALGAWQRGIGEAIAAEHAPGGAHEGMRFPKAAIWVKNFLTTGSIHPGSVIGTEQAVHGVNCEYTFRGNIGGFWVGEPQFYHGVPGRMALLNSLWEDIDLERQWEISDDTLVLRFRLSGLFVPGSFGVVFYY